MTLALNTANTGNFSLLGGPGAGYGTATPQQTGFASTLQTVGPMLAVAGAVNAAIGAYYSAKTTQYQLKSQALNLKFNANMAKLNARDAEVQAQAVHRAAHQQIGQYTMAAGQKKAGAMASMAARGIQAGVGSAQEVAASIDIVTEIDKLTMNANAVRAAEAFRIQGANYSSQATLLGMSAQNAATSAGTINPYTAGTSSLLGSAGNLALAWSARNNPYGVTAGMSF